MRETVLWLSEIGRPMWPADTFDVAMYERAAFAGELVLGYEHFSPVACMLMQTRDEVYWPNDPAGEALYLHKVAVRRTSAGKGWLRRLVYWAREEAKCAGAEFLRIDTLQRVELLSLYGRLGFQIVDEYARHSCGEMIVRLELPLFASPTPP